MVEVLRSPANLAVASYYMTEHLPQDASKNPVSYTLRMRRTVLVGFTLLVSLMSSLAILAYHHLTDAEAGMSEIIKINNHKTELYYSMRISARERIIALHRMLQTDDPFERDDLALKHSGLATSFIRAREELDSLRADDDESILFEELSAILKKTQPLQTRVVELALDGMDREAKEIFAGATLAQEIALDAIDRLLDKQEQRNELRNQLAEQAYSDAARYLLLIAISMLVVGGFIAAYVWVKVGHASQALIAVNQSLGEANKGLEAATQRAESANIAKSEFLSNISHELRTPMTSVLGILGLLKDGMLGSLSESARPMVDMAHRNSQKLLVLLNDLLDQSKIDLGKLDIKPAKCDLRLELEDAIELFRQQAAEKGLQLEYLVDTAIEKNILADTSRVYQVLINLIGNAIKYTEQGGIFVDVQLKVENAETYVAFRVIDSGIGVAEHKRASIFDKFVQGDGSASRKYGGTGLGLAICKHLVEAMSGEVGLELPEDGGSVFWFFLPYHPLDESYREQPVTNSDSYGKQATLDNESTRH